MKKLYKILLGIISCVSLLSGCSDISSVDESQYAATSTFYVPITQERLFRFYLPDVLQIVETDNNVYWKFSNGDQLFVMEPIDYSVSKLDEESGLYLTDTTIIKDFEDCCIYMQVQKGEVDILKNLLADGYTVKLKNELYVEKQMSELPSYTDMSDSMFLSEHNLYMPEGVHDTMVNIYTAEVICKSPTSWLETWIIDGTFEDIYPQLCSIACTNSGVTEIDKWYSDDTIFYASAGNNIVCAKKLRYNEWYVYYGSSDFLDYILTGVNKVHSTV